MAINNKDIADIITAIRKYLLLDMLSSFRLNNQVFKTDTKSDVSAITSLPIILTDAKAFSSASACRRSGVKRQAAA
jgi:hypothetical protein